MEVDYLQDKLLYKINFYDDKIYISSPNKTSVSRFLLIQGFEKIGEEGTFILNFFFFNLNLFHNTIFLHQN